LRLSDLQLAEVVHMSVLRFIHRWWFRDDSKCGDTLPRRSAVHESRFTLMRALQFASAQYKHGNKRAYEQSNQGPIIRTTSVD